MKMEGMEGAILIFMLGNMEQTVARKQTKGRKTTHRNGQKGGNRRAYGCFGMPWFRCLLLPDGVL